MRMNLHNHSTFSDGLFKPEEIVEQAIKDKLQCIGFSDHFSTLKLRSFQNSITYENINEYKTVIRSLTDRYQNKIKINVGLEIDFSIARTNLASLSFFNQCTPLNSLDYVLFEYVNDFDMLGLSLIDLINIRSFIKIPVGLAHNFISKNFSRYYEPKELIHALELSNIFIELCPSKRNSVNYCHTIRRSIKKHFPNKDNSYLPYYRINDPYTIKFFTMLKYSNVKLSIGTDTHNEIKEIGDIEDAILFLKEKDLLRNLVPI